MCTPRDILKDLNKISGPAIKYEVQNDGYLFLLIKKTYKEEGDSLNYIGSEIVSESRSVWGIKQAIKDLFDTY